MTAKWQASVTSSRRARLKEKLDHARASWIRPSARDLAKAGELSYGVIPQLEKQLAEAESRTATSWSKRPCGPSRSPRWSSAGPACRPRKMLEGEREKLLRMEDGAGQARDRPERQAVTP
jgi:ATP-dependent Clp protease ATP-binding subunit ClpB